MKRVLVCDDDTTISELVALVLTDAGWTVYTLPDCDNMIQKINTIKPSIIFMDNKIPKQGGIVATKEIKSHPEYQKIPVIYFTAHTDINELAEEAGADLILQKPFGLKELEAVVDQAFDRFADKNTGNVL